MDRNGFRRHLEGVRAVAATEAAVSSCIVAEGTARKLVAPAQRARSTDAAATWLAAAQRIDEFASKVHVGCKLDMAEHAALAQCGSSILEALEEVPGLASVADIFRDVIDVLSGKDISVEAVSRIAAEARILRVLIEAEARSREP